MVLSPSYKWTTYSKFEFGSLNFVLLAFILISELTAMINLIGKNIVYGYKVRTLLS